MIGGKWINNKLTLFKLKQKNLKGQKCKKCGWRKVASNFEETCPHCTEKKGI